MSTFPNDAALAELHITIADFQTTNYVYVSAFMILVYEYTLTVGKERQYFWGRRPGLLEVLFYMNRYFPIVYQIVNVIGVLTYPAFVSISLNIFDSAEPPGASHYGLVVADFPGLTFKACHGTKTSLRLFFLPTLPGLLFDTLVSVLGLWKLLHQAVFLRNTYAVNRNVYQVMTTDASLYFVVMLAVVVVDMIMQTSAARISLRVLWDPMLLVLPSTACTRMVLNLREIGTVETTNVSESTFSGPVGGRHHGSESGIIELDRLRKL
ncbi:hypothetical protein EXIGLDRAFT_773468 [Exidia glandulosa HHB12029]|uniref:DUF6533 domain-containing protein n=1 Tax=Exidia glandulosa HHB12029 TaxID=1314781 RepID=A0A165ESZ9_EXIGL|nr:hypothetical protein EXIGLDRAFT_773468 [Exidia glandulosa HHB12029]